MSHNDASRAPEEHVSGQAVNCSMEHSSILGGEDGDECGRAGLTARLAPQSRQAMLQMTLQERRGRTIKQNQPIRRGSPISPQAGDIRHADSLIPPRPSTGSWLSLRSPRDPFGQFF